jgi:hypothetical protein
MTSTATEKASIPAGAGPELFFQAGKERTEALLNMQKELFDAYQEVCLNWQMRAKSEIDAWSELAKKLTEARSVPESLQAYRRCLSLRLQLASEDGQHLLDDAQKIVGVMTRQYTPRKPAKAA